MMRLSRMTAQPPHIIIHCSSTSVTSQPSGRGDSQLSLMTSLAVLHDTERSDAAATSVCANLPCSDENSVCAAPEIDKHRQRHFTAASEDGVNAGQDFVSVSTHHVDNVRARRYRVSEDTSQRSIGDNTVQETRRRSSERAISYPAISFPGNRKTQAESKSIIHQHRRRSMTSRTTLARGTLTPETKSEFQALEASRAILLSHVQNRKSRTLATRPQ